MIIKKNQLIIDEKYWRMWLRHAARWTCWYLLELNKSTTILTLPAELTYQTRMQLSYTEASLKGVKDQPLLLTANQLIRKRAYSEKYIKFYRLSLKVLAGNKIYLRWANWKYLNK